MLTVPESHSEQLLVAVAIVALCAFLILLTRHASAQERTVRPTSVWNGVYAEQEAERGKDLYLRECSSCHLEDLMGLEYAPPLTVEYFLSDFGLGARTVGDLFENIRTTMPKKAPGSLSTQVYSDILAYILKSNSFPPGQRGLRENADILKDIQITAKPPQ